jgi:UMF1 family MFS transporter
LGAQAWAVLEAGRSPYFFLVIIYVFMPYFSSVFVGSALKGQATISFWAQIAGVIVMFTAPLLGASVDQIGRRKPLLAPMVFILCSCIFSFWWAVPDQSGLSTTEVMVIFVLITIVYANSEVLYNSLLVRAAGFRSANKASGLGIAYGSALSFLSLLTVLWAFGLPGHVNWGFIPAQPLFGLNVKLHEPDRIAAPIAATLMFACALPFFFLTPDAEPTHIGLAAAVRSAPAALWGTIKSLHGNRDAMLFLLGRMLFFDGMTAIAFYIGVYASGVMGWGALELLCMGLINTAIATLGGMFARWLDGLIGPRIALMIEVGVSALCIVALVGMRHDTILFYWVYPHGAPAVWSSSIFSTLPELVFIAICVVISVVVPAHWASSRTLLTRLTPPERSGAFFGLYALSGTATTWLGSALVSFGTNIFKSQQGGFAGVALLLTLGFSILCFVRGGNRLHENTDISERASSWPTSRKST